MSWNKYVVSENEATPLVTPLGSVEKQLDGESGVYEAVMVCVPAEMPPAVPVTGESFCQCPAQIELTTDTPVCTCGEEEQGCDWVWDEDRKSAGVSLSCWNRKVSFYSEYSCGTAAVRGERALTEGQHFWEIKMTSPVYGTDMMVGVGTSEVNLDQFRHSFCSLLGTDEDSWGLSYTGHLHHKGSKVSFSSRFGQGSIIGLHLDLWHGTLSFYKNRRCIGVAATHLQNKRLFPMACSTAAKSSMKLIRSHSCATSLQYLCCHALPRHALHALPLPPGLRLLLANQLGWVLTLGDAHQAPPDDCECFSDPAHDQISLTDVTCFLDSPDHTLYSSPAPEASCPCCDRALSAVSYADLRAAPQSHAPCPACAPPCQVPEWVESASDSESDDFCSDLKTCKRKRCRWT